MGQCKGCRAAIAFSQFPGRKKRIKRHIKPGDVFGRWTVLSEGGYVRRSERQLWCRCSCRDATVRLVSIKNLIARRKPSRSCGCWKRELDAAWGMAKVLKLTEADKSGRLTPIEPAGENKGHRLWRCLCDCGRYVNKKATDIRDKRVMSCGRLCLLGPIPRGSLPKKYRDAGARAQHKRYALKRGDAGPQATQIELDALLISQNNRCGFGFCRAEMTDVNREREHWESIASPVGHKTLPVNGIENALYACTACNRRKWRHNPHVWNMQQWAKRLVRDGNANSRVAEIAEMTVKQIIERYGIAARLVRRPLRPAQIRRLELHAAF
jgi:hypothetical protein